MKPDTRWIYTTTAEEERMGGGAYAFLVVVRSWAAEIEAEPYSAKELQLPMRASATAENDPTRRQKRAFLCLPPRQLFHLAQKLNISTTLIILHMDML